MNNDENSSDNGETFEETLERLRRLARDPRFEWAMAESLAKMEDLGEVALPAPGPELDGEVRVDQYLNEWECFRHDGQDTWGWRPVD